MAKSDYDIIVLGMPGPEGLGGPRIKGLRLPEGAIITLITRGGEIVLPKGDTQLQGWDEVTILAHAPHENEIRSKFSEAFPLSEQLA